MANDLLGRIPAWLKSLYEMENELRDAARKRGLTRQERSAALGALSTFIHAMGWTRAVQDQLEQRSRDRR